MFSQKINDSPFTTGDANGFFKGRIDQFNSGADQSLLSTLRALLYKRIKSDTIFVKYSRSAFSKGDVEGVNIETLTRYTISGELPEVSNMLFVHNVDGVAVDRNATLKLFREEFVNYYGVHGFERVQKVTDFFRRSFEVMCFVNPKTKTSVLIVDRLTMRKLHAVQAAVFAFLPWYFDPEGGISEDEKDLIQSLREKTPDKYNEVLKRMFAKCDIRAEIIKTKLTGFEERYMEREIERLQSFVNDRNAKIDSMIRSIAEYSNDINVNLVALSSLKEEVDNPRNEVMDYFLHNKNLILIEVHGSQLTFGVKTKLSYFDEEFARKIIDKPQSVIYRYVGAGGIDRDAYAGLMRAIFLDQTLKINMCAKFKIQIGGEIIAVDGALYPESEYAGYTPNPHLHHYGCLGNNRAHIAQCLKNNNIIGAIEQCCAAASGLNLTDSTVIEHFMKTLCTNRARINHCCIELPDGNVVTPKEAIAWLNSHTVQGE